MHRKEGTGTAANHVTVTAHADAGVFPEGTSMKVTAASSDSAMQAAEKLLDSPVIDVAAVDISFEKRLPETRRIVQSGRKTPGMLRRNRRRVPCSQLPGKRQERKPFRLL